MSSPNDAYYVEPWYQEWLDEEDRIARALLAAESVQDSAQGKP